MIRQKIDVAQRRMLRISSSLIILGLGLFACVVCVYLYASFDTWAAAQPRMLTASQEFWPEAPPFTPLPPPSATPKPTATPTPSPTPGPAVRIEIPRIGVDRAIVPIGLIDRNGQQQWDVDSLFATSSRPDLVGQLQGTSNPGQPGNLVLVGHNYNLGLNLWTAVFYSLPSLVPGDLIYIINDADTRLAYQVERTEQIPWPPASVEDIMAHSLYYAPTTDEVITLITCSGGTDAPFPMRVYVRARRVPDK